MAAHALGATETEQRLRAAYSTQTELALEPTDEQPQGNGHNGNGHSDAGAVQVPQLMVSLQRCPDCNGPVLQQEGCLTCPSCGWNKCG